MCASITEIGEHKLGYDSFTFFLPSLLSLKLANHLTTTTTYTPKKGSDTEESIFSHSINNVFYFFWIISFFIFLFLVPFELSNRLVLNRNTSIKSVEKKNM